MSPRTQQIAQYSRTLTSCLGNLKLAERETDEVRHRELAALHLSAEPCLLGVGHTRADVVGKVVSAVALGLEHFVHKMSIILSAIMSRISRKDPAVGYAHIENLYKNQTILLFRRCWALEKVHGTSAHVTYRAEGQPQLSFFSGGENHDRFVALFDAGALTTQFTALGHREVSIYGEAYGGRQWGMRATYGDALKFIAFDVQVGETWLSVPDADQVVAALGLEFVPFLEVSTDLVELDHARDAPSVVAQRRGCGGDKPREGVVLRPPVEMTLNNGHRVVAKHKREAFSERATPQKVVDPAKLAILAEAQAIAQEWVTPMRLSHVLDKLPRPLDMRATPQVIAAMIADVYREAAGEVVESRDATTAIGRRTAGLFKEWLQAQTTSQQR